MVTLFQTYRCLQFNCPVPHRHHCWSPHLKPLHQRQNLRPRHLLHAVECPAHLLPYPRRGRENPSGGSARARTLNLVHHQTLTSLSGELFHQQQITKKVQKLMFFHNFGLFSKVLGHGDFVRSDKKSGLPN